MTGLFQAPSVPIALIAGLCGGALFAGCLRPPDAGGQEGEERWPGHDAESAVGGGEDDDAADTVESESEPEPEGLSGTRNHLRGAGDPGDYACDLTWTATGTANTEWCDDCTYAFDVEYTLDTDASTRAEYACGDVYADQQATVGVVPDYHGYGPMVVARDPYTGDAYWLGPANRSGDGLWWSYGYRDEAWSGDGYYYTWYWRVDVTLE